MFEYPFVNTDIEQSLCVPYFTLAAIPILESIKDPF